MLFILIPGLILVALMVYASTRIKRVAAEAFEPETIDTDDFSLEKPDGFLNVINHDEALALDIYSRDMGKGEAAEFRAARAEVRVYEKRSLDYAVSAIRETVAVGGETSEVINETKYRVIEAERVDEGIVFEEKYKVAEKDGRVFEFKIVALSETNGEFQRKIDTMLNSFMLK